MPGPYPLTTLAATVDENGISAPAFVDIFLSLQASYFAIYGADANLAEDSQDGQWIAVIAKAIDDTNQRAISVYNDFSPQSAVGVGLSSVVKVNGLKREVPTFSQVDVDVVGQVGKTVTGGIVRDPVLGTLWDLPSAFDIPVSGTITVQAICQSPGAIAAAPNTITEIATPQPGWQTVTNPAAATLGASVESDAALRLRQSVSTSLPAVGPLKAVNAAVANIANVLRTKSYQNDTNTTDANGIPAHNVAIVVEGGDPIAIATAIADKKAPGVPTYGTTSEIIIDDQGVPNTIKFFQLTNVTVSVRLFATALTGYVSGTGEMIVAAVAEFESTLEIGEDSYRGRIWSPANLSGTAAQVATGLPQSQLDVLSATYDLYEVAQARNDMVAVGGPFAAGATTIHVTNTANYATGKVIYITLDDLNLHTAVVTGVSGVAVSFAPAIPVSRSAQNGALVYVVGDVAIAFNEAVNTAVADVMLAVS